MKTRATIDLPLQRVGAHPVDELISAWRHTNQPHLHQCVFCTGYEVEGPHHIPQCDFRQVNWADAITIARQVIRSARSDGASVLKAVDAADETHALADGDAVLGEAAASLITDPIELSASPLATTSSIVLNGRHRIAAIADEGDGELLVPVRCG